MSRCPINEPASPEILKTSKSVFVEFLPGAFHLMSHGAYTKSPRKPKTYNIALTKTHNFLMKYLYRLNTKAFPDTSCTV